MLLGYRRNLMAHNVASASDTCEQVMSQVCTDFDATLAEFNGEQDHVHLLAAYPPKVALSHLVNSLKGVSSRRMRQDFAGRINKAATRGRFWSPSYFAGSCGGPPLTTVQDYIADQKRPDQARIPPCPQGQGFHPRSPMISPVSGITHHVIPPGSGSQNRGRAQCPAWA